MSTATRFCYVLRSLTLSVCMIVLLSLISEVAASGWATWDDANPSEIHRVLAESKASALVDRDFIRQMATGGRLDNTQLNYDILYYEVAIRVDDTAQILYGNIGFHGQIVGSEVTQIQVDLQADMLVDSIVAPTGILTYSRSGDVVTVFFDFAHFAGDPFEFDFHYHGHPNEAGFKAFSFDIRLNEIVISSLSEPYYARSWWPCKDRMDDKADSFNIQITVDTSFYVASNGTLDSVINHGDNSHTYYYFEQYPMVSYLFSVAISNYTVWEDEWVYNDGADTLPLVHAVYPDKYTYSLGKYNITPYALSVFAKWFGPYPFPKEKYGHANFEWGGGMEHQTMTSMSGSTFGFSEPVVVHELAHQWWGNMITTKSWGHIWLNEGWASYSEALYYLEKEGWSRYHDYMDAMAYTGGGTIFVYDTTSVNSIFHGGLSYDKGAWVVHMLRGVLGDSLFFESVEAYYNSPYKYGAATTEEFRDVFEQASGVELDWFFQEWIYGEYRPDYRYSWTQEPSDQGGMDVYLLITQVQTTSPQVFHMPVDFFFDFASVSDDTLTLVPDQRRNLFKFNFPGAVSNIWLDPRGWVLKYANSTDWGMHIVTNNEDLMVPTKYLPYVDTVEAIGGSSSQTFTLLSGSLPPGLILDASGIISGAPSDTGNYSFTVRAVDNSTAHVDEVSYELTSMPSTLIPGDIDHSQTDPDIVDLVYLVDYQFRGGPVPPVMNLADVDGSCRVDIVDLVRMVDFMFNPDSELPDLIMGCVE